MLSILVYLLSCDWSDSEKLESQCDVDEWKSSKSVENYPNFFHIPALNLSARVTNQWIQTDIADSDQMKLEILRLSASYKRKQVS